MTRLTGAILCSLALLPALGGCQRAIVADLQQDVVRLQTRLEEMERTGGRNRVLLEEMEERVFLLQDRMEAARIALQRRGPSDGWQPGPAPAGPAPGAVAWSGTPATMPPAQPWSPMPSASTPAPPRPDVDPLLRPPALPVQRLVPDAGQGAAQGGTPVALPAAEEEVLITNATLAERYGSEVRLSAGAPASGGRPALPGHSQPLDPSDYPLQAGGSDSTPAEPPRPPASAPSATGAGGLGAYREAIDLFNGARYGEALQRLTDFIAGSPEPDYMDNALFWSGECHYGLGEYDRALAYFQRVVQEYPDGNKVPDSWLKLALTHERLGQMAEAVEALTTLTDTYPSTDAARRASERLRALR
jgi:tol-pal system protein YbgF